MADVLEPEAGTNAESIAETPLPDPSAIMQIGMGFWPSKTLLSAVELGLFTLLGSGSLTAGEIADQLQLRSRAVFDFLDGLVALGLLEREGSGELGRYANTRETAVFLDANSPQHIGGFLEMVNARLYGFWGGLTNALQTGQPQNEIKHSGRSMFEELYADPTRLEQFMGAMSGISAGNFHALAEKFDFSPLQHRLRRRRCHRDSCRSSSPSGTPISRARVSTCPPWNRSPGARSRPQASPTA